MPAPYSQDLRRKVVQADERGEGSMRVLARRFSVGLGFVRDLIKRYRETGEVKPKASRRGIKPKIRGAGEEAVRKWVRETPDLTLNELCQRYQAIFNQKVSKSAMDRTLKRLNLTPKKRHSKTLSGKASGFKGDGLNIQEKVSAYSAEKRIYLDERGAPLDLVLEYGRAPKGERAHGERPTSQGERISTLGALSTQGIITALCFEGTLNGSVFLYFLKHFLCPPLKPGRVVIMDNASPHKVEEGAERIEETGAELLYLPPCPPELNPIEMAWSSIKHFLRKAQARTKEALYEALAKAINTLPPEQAKAYFEHVGVSV